MESMVGFCIVVGSFRGRWDQNWNFLQKQDDFRQTASATFCYRF
jgi:hypothetical protein